MAPETAAMPRDAEAEHRQTEGDQPARDAADEEDDQQPEHLASRPPPAHGDRFAHPDALDDDDRADERQTVRATYVTGMSATSVISTTTATRADVSSDPLTKMRATATPMTMAGTTTMSRMMTPTTRLARK